MSLSSPACLCAGNAPTLMSMEDMRKVIPVWFNMSIAIHNDPEASKEWGWVQVILSKSSANCCAGVYCRVC